MIISDSLCSLDNVKAAMGIAKTDTARDAQIEFFIPAISQLITKSCNRTFFLASNPANPRTIFKSGSNDQYLVLPAPVQSITSIYEDDNAEWGSTTNSFAAQTLLLPGTDYSLVLDGDDGTWSKSGIVYRQNAIWWGQWSRDWKDLAAHSTGGKGNIKIIFTEGWNFLPLDLAYATTVAVARAINIAATGYPLKSEGFQDAHYVSGVVQSMWGIIGGELSPIISKYRRLSIGSQI